MRDCPGFAIYFGFFELIKRSFGVSEQDRLVNNYNGMNESTISFRKFSAGGIAGLSSWSFLFPFDTLKTKMQTTQGV